MVRRCRADFNECVAAIKRRIEEGGATVFAVIDHSRNARDAGLALDDDVVIIFGNPRAGTILMQLDRRMSYDLPLRVAVWRGEDGATYIGYRMPSDVAREHGVSHDVVGKMDEFMNWVLNGLTEEATNEDGAGGDH
ncbi:DUF302 domain-containing protein [Thermocladium modestius]|nr:DUF302 domain-containing protein [Thermocladium modestius]